MIQSTSTRHFKNDIENGVKKEVDMDFEEDLSKDFQMEEMDMEVKGESKEELVLDWDEVDNCHGQIFDNADKKYMPKVVLEKLPLSVLQKYNITKNAAPNKKTSESLPKCSKCERTYQNKNSLTCRICYCGKEPDIKCDQCSYKTRYKIGLIIHNSKVHKNGKKIENADERRLKKICEKCNKAARKLSLTKCEKCFGKLINYEDLPVKPLVSADERNESYYDTVHGTANVDCDKCGRKFRKKHTLRDHLRHCGVEPRFQCAHCPFRCLRKKNLKSHLSDMHMRRIHITDRSEAIKTPMQRFSLAKLDLNANCTKCKKEQCLSARLKMCKICKSKLSYRCKTCKNKYDVDDENACIHVKTYLETIKFECKRCRKGAVSEQSLLAHERACYSETMFKCRFCKYAARFKGNTVRHEKVHHPHEL